MHYNSVLEHIDIHKGYDYLKYINNEFNDIFNNNLNFFINLCNINDYYGNTIKENFTNFCICSPSNLRYIYHSLLIFDHFKKLNIKNIDIIEIGGGYGGLSFFINNLSYLFNFKIKSYTIFDLPSVSILQKNI